jgi:sodium-dependent dicarboxylate transporter 2/3/5
MPKILLVDDDDKFRSSLARRLSLRGYDVIDVDNGEEAIRIARNDLEIEVIVLDLKMPGMTGDEALREIRVFRPAVQVIMLTGYGSVKSAMDTARMDAFAYLSKPCDFDEFVQTVEEAREAKVHAMTRHEVAPIVRGSAWKWLWGSPNHRPGIVLSGMLLFAAITLGPSPARLTELLSHPKTGQSTDATQGYAHYPELEAGESIAAYYGHKYELTEVEVDDSGERIRPQLTTRQAAFRARVMLATLLVAAMFWATGAVPIGITALFVGCTMYFFGVLRPDDVAMAYAKDAVIFIFGVLAISKAITKTGLDRRIGMLMLGSATSLTRLLFFFLPMLAITCSFVSEHALIAFVMPLFMVIYTVATRSAGVKQDKALAVMLALSLCYAGNAGGPGSPAAGGRNAVMLGILSDYDIAPSFAEWVMYGLPFVPVMAIVTALYFFVVLRKRVLVKDVNPAAIIRRSAEQIGPMNGREIQTAIVLVALIAMWVTLSDRFGMGGPVILCIVVLNVLRILRWKDISTISWDVVFLYASAAALGKGLAVTGAALYLADGFVNALPTLLQAGPGLAIATSAFTGIVTNFMSDGATVSAIGPIAVPMATLSGTHPWMIGLAVAFASSFAHVLVIGTPNNAIVYALAKDPETGEQLVGLGDFIKHGTAVLIFSLLVLWGWVVLGYWQMIGF